MTNDQTSDLSNTTKILVQLDDNIAQITTGSADMEEQMTNVRSLVQQDPALVAQVVKNWTASDA